MRKRDDLISLVFFFTKTERASGEGYAIIFCSMTSVYCVLVEEMFFYTGCSTCFGQIFFFVIDVSYVSLLKIKISILITLYLV